MNQIEMAQRCFQKRELVKAIFEIPGFTTNGRSFLTSWEISHGCVCNISWWTTMIVMRFGFLNSSLLARSRIM